MSFTLEPVARVESARAEPVDDDWSNVEQTIVLDESFPEDALAGIEDFSHLEVLYILHRVDPATVERGKRRPRGNPDWPEVGIFAQRAKDRPNRLGSTTCRLVKRDGRRLHVVDLDCIDGTPVVDIKPHLAEFRPHGAYRQSRWAGELMLEYWRSHGEVCPGMVDYDALKAAFSVLAKPAWVKGDSFEIDMDDVGVQRLIDRNPDALTESDFWGYVDTCVPGCIEDFRFLLPPMLRIWEEQIYGVDSAFPYHFVNKLLTIPVLRYGLSEELQEVVFAFMRRAIAARIAAEDSLEVVGKTKTHYWVESFNDFGALSYSFPDLWRMVWSAEQRGHAVALLQYVTSLVYDEDDNPIFAPYTGERGGGPLSVRSVSFDVNGVGWLEANIEFLEKALHTQCLLERMDFLEERYPGDRIAELAAQTRAHIESNRDEVGRRCRELPHAFTAEGVADEDTIADQRTDGTELRSWVKRLDELPASLGALIMGLPKYDEVDGKRAITWMHGETRLVLIEDPDHPWAGTGGAQACLEVPSADFKRMMLAQNEELRLSAVRRHPGRDELYVQAPGIGPILFFSRG